MSALRPLRPHQVAALDMLRASLASGCASPLLRLPTGAGKTRIAGEIIRGLRSRMLRSAFCVPSIGLVDQTFESLVADGIEPSDMGVIQGNHPWYRPHAPIQICTAQTLARRSLPDVDAVIVDEAHVRHEVIDRWIASTLGRQISSLTGKSDASATLVATEPKTAAGKLPRPFFIGLSATPWSRGLGQLYDDLIKPTDAASLIADGYLSPYRVYAPSHPDLSGVRTVAGDFHEGDLAERMNREGLVADVVQTWLARGEGRPTLCFATGRAHAQALYERFTAAGVPAAYVDANTDRTERDEIGRKLASGEVKVVCNIGCLTTGIDWIVRCLILARPTKSESLFVQIIGRALRPEYASGFDLETAEGRAAAIAAGPKPHAIILDHSDTHLRLGMATDIDRDELDAGKAQKSTASKDRDSAPLPKECPTCAGLIPAGASVCPCCGAERPKPQFREADGELLELPATGTAMAKVDRKRGRGSIAEAIVAMGKAEVYAELLWFAKERGRAPGWAAHVYRELFDVWPRGLSDEASQTSPLVRGWLRSRDIAYAKSKARRAVAEAHHA